MKRNNNKKRMTKRNSSKNERRDKEIINTSKDELKSDAREYRDCRSRDNDPAWYAQSPQIIRDFASLPFGNPLGSKLPSTVFGPGNGYSISGIMTLYYTPAIGVASTENSAINVAMRNIYSYVRHANSGHANYDAPDLMLYLLAMDSVYMFHAWVKRLYGQLMLATTYNRYYPKALIESELVDYEDLQANIADFRGFINLYAVKAGAMAVPNSMSFMARHTWMTEGLYVDDASTPKAQTYKYVPENFWKFQLDDQGAGSLVNVGQCIGLAGGIVSNRKFADIVALGNQLLNPILANEDMNIMSGDILKAFGESGIVKMSGITEDYMVLPSYSPEVLSQIENATIYTGQAITKVTQATAVGTGYLQSAPIVNVGNCIVANPSNYSVPPQSGTAYMYELKSAYSGDRLLNMHTQDVTPEMVMVATRLMSSLNITNQPTYSTLASGNFYVNGNVSSCGSEIVSGALMWSYDYNSANTAVSLNSKPIATCMVLSLIPNYVAEPGQSDFTISATAAVRALTPVLAQLSQYDWHPLVSVAIATINRAPSSTPKPGTIGSFDGTKTVMADLANYTTISEANIENMNSIALLSEFSVPQVGLFKG